MPSVPFIHQLPYAQPQDARQICARPYNELPLSAATAPTAIITTVITPTAPRLVPHLLLPFLIIVVLPLLIALHLLHTGLVGEPLLPHGPFVVHPRLLLLCVQHMVSARTRLAVVCSWWVLRAWTRLTMVCSWWVLGARHLAKECADKRFATLIGGFPNSVERLYAWKWSRDSKEEKGRGKSEQEG